MRDRFSDFEKNAEKLLNIEQGTGKYKKERIRKRNTKFDDENAIASEETSLTGRTKFRVTYLVIIDKLNQAIRHRETAYQTVYKRFYVLFSFDDTDIDVRAHARELAEEYPLDISITLFPPEMVQFKSFSSLRGCSSPQAQALMLHEEDLQDTFPNVFVAFRIYLSLMVTNCSGERSFSKLALIKNKLRSTMMDERLSALTLMSIESDILRQINFFSSLIQTFASLKSRKCQF